jgi:hypothetical protein
MLGVFPDAPLLPGLPPVEPAAPVPPAPDPPPPAAGTVAPPELPLEPCPFGAACCSSEHAAPNTALTTTTERNQWTTVDMLDHPSTKRVPIEI